MPKENHKIDSIQILRAVAVILVVYTHSIDSSSELFNTSRQIRFFYLENWGSIGLDLFFVISGFIMTRIIGSYQQADGWKLFAYKRALRIVPLYWGVSLIAAILVLRTYPIRWATVIKTLLFFPVNESVFEFPIVGVGWSLSFEIYFYAIITILLLFHSRKPQQVTFLLLVALTIIGSFTDSSIVLLRFLTSPLLFEFALGVGAGLLYTKIHAGTSLAKTGMVTFILGGLGMMSSIFWNYGNMSEAGSVTESNYLASLRCVIWGIPCAFFLLGSTLLERAYSLSMPAILIRIGDASYSNYLLHGLLISFGRRAILKLNLSADMYILFLVLLCTVASLFMYQFVEKPITMKLTNFFFPRKLKAPANSVEAR